MTTLEKKAREYIVKVCTGSARWTGLVSPIGAQSNKSMKLQRIKELIEK